MCARFYRRTDGTVLTQDCPVGLRALGRRLATRIGFFAFLAFLLAFGAALCGENYDEERVPSWQKKEPFATVFQWLGIRKPPKPPARDTVMGSICMPPPGK
jgi:hypothetical protein